MFYDALQDLRKEVDAVRSSHSILKARAFGASLPIWMLVATTR